MQYREGGFGRLLHFHFEQALRLKPEERFLLVVSLLKSLDEPDQELDTIWAEEAEKRLRAYREGKLEGIPMEDIFEEDS